MAEKRHSASRSETKNRALEKQGHDVVTWETPEHPDITKNMLAAFFDLGGAAIMDFLEPYGEPIYPSMAGYKAASAAGESDLGPTKMRMMNLWMERNDLIVL
ncbi:amidase signature enzyme [Lasallia pustulata]|uniref:Amidase signature enzyme n=1 Tax=Lasallia pustulata TaxID=136370 RepID=A0A1W5D6D3_9LECA|nr:amidase signature enzyme [Lasallia pustulata]